MGEDCMFLIGPFVYILRGAGVGLSNSPTIPPPDRHSRPRTDTLGSAAQDNQYLPIGSIVVPFWEYLFPNMNHTKAYGYKGF